MHAFTPGALGSIQCHMMTWNNTSGATDLSPDVDSSPDDDSSHDNDSSSDDD